MNGKFIEKYGQSWGEMDADTRQLALMSEIYDLKEMVSENRRVVTEHYNQFNTSCVSLADRLDKQESLNDRRGVYWKVLLFIASPVALAFIAFVVDYILK